MIEVLKVMLRVFLIVLGLAGIGVGGLCTVLGSSAGMTASWVAMLGIVTFLVGVAIVWLAFRGLRNKTPAAAANETNGESQ